MASFVPRRIRFWIAREAKRVAWVFCFLIFLVLCIDSFGLVNIYFEKNFETEFTYPLEIQKFPEVVRRFGRGEKVNYLPINYNYSRISFLHEPVSSKSDEDANLIILVKSAPKYLDKRQTIRATWGNPQYLDNLSKTIGSTSPLQFCFTDQSNGNSNFKIRLLFLLGQTEDGPRSTPQATSQIYATSSNDMYRQMINSSVLPIMQKSQTAAQQEKRRKRGMDDLTLTIPEEILIYDDIILADFLDSYENNTMKTMMGLRYAFEKCPKFEFVLLADDDMFINMENVVRFLEAPLTYPMPQINAKFSINIDSKDDQCRTLQTVYAGKVLYTRPVRQKLGSNNKWYLPLEEYPFNSFPPYTPAAATIMSRSVVEDFYLASLFTEHFRFDDVYLGILAQKMGIAPINSEYFLVCHSPTGKCSDASGTESGVAATDKDGTMDPTKNIIAKHGLSGVKELMEFWNAEKAKQHILCAE